MSKGNLSLRYYLFSLSNLLAAFGGGLILGKGIGAIDVSFLKNASILAFFIGTIFGLAFLYLVPKKISKSLSQYFSLCCAITSIILFFLFKDFSEFGKISGNIGFMFFIILSIRFGFWFYSRVIRASNSSGQQQSIAWVELGYYSGMILGLIIWKLLNINIDLGFALIIDAIFQLIASGLDFKAYTIPLKENSKVQCDNINLKESVPIDLNPNWLWKLSLSVVLLTIGVQVVIFNLSHHVDTGFSTYILAIFYFGVALAAYIANKSKIFIFWENNVPLIFFGSNKKINFSLFSFTIIMSLISMIFLINSDHMEIFNKNLSHFLLGSLVFLASFIYELISLSILDRIGYEEKILNKNGMIMKTYALMGLGATISLGVLGLFDNYILMNLSTIIFCFIFLSKFLYSRQVDETDFLEGATN